MAPRRLASTLLLLALVALVALASVGCSAQHCWPDGDCITTPGNGWFYTRWVGAVVCLFLAFAGANAMDDTGPKVFVLLLFGVPAVYALPGLESPDRKAIAAHEKQRSELQREAAQQTANASPEGQLAATRALHQRIATRLTKQLEPLIDKYKSERTGYLDELRRELPRAGITSHEQLLRKRDKHQRLANVLHRAAVLENSLDWLGKKRSEAEGMQESLDQSAWRLEKLIEMNGVAAPEEAADIKRLLATADRVLDDKIAPPEKQDVAEIEQRLFGELTGKKKGAP